MNIKDLIEILKQKQEELGNITVCVYDSGLLSYSENLCLEVVDDDYFLDQNEEYKEDKFLLL